EKRFHLGRILTAFLTVAVAFQSLAFAQQRVPANSVTRSAERAAINLPKYLTNIAAAANVYTEQLPSPESERIAAMLANDASANPGMIGGDNDVRDTVVKNAALALWRSEGRAVYSVEWRNLLSNMNGDADALKAVDEILDLAAASNGRVVLNLGDLSALIGAKPRLGTIISDRIRTAIAEDNVRVIGFAERDQFSHFKADRDLRAKFEAVELENFEKDPFVGSKIAPELQAMIANEDANKRVRVIVQAKDINDRELLSALRRNSVTADKTAANLNMIVAEMPLKAVRPIADVRAAQHLSLDRKLTVLGHIETTTGASLVRTIQRGVRVGLLGLTLINTTVDLDGEGIGIAVVDSGIREDHRSFVNRSGRSRVKKRANFAPGNSVSTDRFGHGTHVAS